jgi:hypothetical protein
MKHIINDDSPAHQQAQDKLLRIRSLLVSAFLLLLLATPTVILSNQFGHPTRKNIALPASGIDLASLDIVSTAAPTEAATLTPTPIPTPSIPVWDDFSSPATQARKWQTDGERYTAKVVDGVLRLETPEWMLRWVGSRQRIRAIAALVTLQKGNGEFGLQALGSTSFNIYLTCNTMGVNIIPTAKFRRVFYNTLPVLGCPTTHLLFISLDGKMAHFFMDGKEIATSQLDGYAVSARITLGGDQKTSTVALVHKVWVDFAK